MWYINDIDHLEEFSIFTIKLKNNITTISSSILGNNYPC